MTWQRCSYLNLNSLGTNDCQIMQYICFFCSFIISSRVKFIWETFFSTLPFYVGLIVLQVNLADVIILEGILVFHDPRVRALMNMKIFVDTGPLLFYFHYVYSVLYSIILFPVALIFLTLWRFCCHIHSFWSCGLKFHSS